ncbi:hypothetical protein P3S67_020599 [Capsicum chacoense]
MADTDSYKKIHTEFLRELQRRFNKLQRDLADFGARLRRALLLPDENCPVDNNNSNNNNNSNDNNNNNSSSSNNN